MKYIIEYSESGVLGMLSLLKKHHCIFIIGLIIWLSFIDIIPLAMATGPLSYSMRFLSMSKEGGANNTFNLYLPATNPSPGIYDYGALGKDKSFNINLDSNLLVRSYQIYAWYDLEVAYSSSYNNVNESWFKIYQCFSDGTLGEQIINHNFYYPPNNYIPNMRLVTINPNEGIYVQINTGNHNTPPIGFNCFYRIIYYLDEASPNAPGTPTLIDNNSTIKKVDSTHYITSLNSIPIQWSAAEDKGSTFTTYAGTTHEIKSGIGEYRININNNQANEKSVPGNQLSTYLTDLNEGDNKVKIQACDKEPTNQPGEYGGEIIIKVDRTAPTIPGIPKASFDLKANTLTWTWASSYDETGGTGFAGYKIFITAENADGTREDLVTWKDVTYTSYSHQVEDGKKYICKVKAVDLVNNESLASPEGVYITDTSVPDVTLPTYSVLMEGLKAVVRWNAITTDYSGVETYEIALTTTASEPSEEQIISVSTSDNEGSDSLWQKSVNLPFLNKDSIYYIWIRGVDQIGNHGDWVSTSPFPEFDIIDPDDKTYTNQLSPEFGIKKRSFAEDKDLRFEIFYKKPNETPKKFSETEPFPGEGHFLWWIEVYEYLNGNKQENSKQTSKEYTLYIDQTAPTGSFGISSVDGSKDYTQFPTNKIDMKLTGIKDGLSDTGIVNSGIKGIYLWDRKIQRPDEPLEQIPPSKAKYFKFDQIPADGNIEWQFIDENGGYYQDGDYRIYMLVEDNAGNRSNLANLPYRNVTLDRTAPEAPVNIVHTQGDGSINFTWQAGSASDGLALYRCTYQLPEETPVDFKVLPSGDNSGVKIVPITGTEPNQPVIIKIKAVDQAGNESIESSYTAYTPAQPGQLQFVSGGYNPSTERHYMIWKATPSVAKQIQVEYSLGETEFKSLGTISLNEEGLFIHESLPNPDGVQPLPLSPHDVYSYRLVAVNESDDKKYSEVETKQVPNQKPSIPEITAPLQFARDSVEFQFTSSIDQDDDPLTYTVHFAEGANPNPSDFKPLTGFIKEGLVHGRTYSWYLHVEDGYGGDSTDKMSFTVDTEDPELDVEEAVRPYTNQEQLTISASDSLSGIDLVTYKKYILNQKGEVEREENGEISLTVDLDGKSKGVFPLTEGHYHLHLTAWDKAGNDYPVERNNLIVDHTSPELSEALLKLPQANGRYLCGSGQVPLAWRGTDSSSGVRNLRYWIIPSQGEPLGAGKTLALSSGLTDYEYNFDLTGINGNEYFLAIALEDKAGNRSPEQYLGPILLDTTGPQGQLKLSGFAVYGSNYYLTTFDSLVPELEASDPESGISSIRYAVIDTTTGSKISAWADWKTIKQTALTEGKTYKIAVQLVNGSGLETEYQSVGFTYDASAPENLAISGPADPLAQGEQGLFTVSATENESRIIAYRFAIGSTQGGKELTSQVPGNIDGWLILNTENTSAQFRVEIPMMADGTYYPTFEALNAAGLKQTKTGSKFIINNNQSKTVVGDQGPYTEFNDYLTGWWRYSGPETVVGYRYRIVNVENGEPVRNWEPTTETEVTVTGLNLENGLTYRFEVEADLGGISVSGVSPGVKVDTTKATITKLETPQYSTSTNLSFAWAGEDRESEITRIEVALGTDFYQTNVTKGWVQVSGDRPQLTRDRNGEELNLVSGQRYYLTLRLINGSGLVTEQAAPAIIIDNTPPPAPLVIDQGAYINDRQPLEANWLWSEVDPESGVIYEWALLDNSQDLNNVSWNPGPDNFRIRLEDFTQEHGHTYYFAVKAINGAGLTTVAVSNGIMIDSTAPLIPRVVVLEGVDIGDPATAEEVNYLTSTEELTLWIDSMDLESDINRYEYTYGSRDDVDAAPKETSTSDTVELEGVALLDGEVSIFKGECFNNAELVSQPGYSTGVMLDTGAPQISNVKAGVSGNQILFDWEAESSACPIAGYVVALVADGLESANLPDSAWQDVKLSRSAVIDGSDMADGDYRLLVRAYNRAGTYSERGISPKVTLDRTPPVVQELICAKYASSQLSAAVVVEDNLSGIHSIQYSLGSLTNPVAYTGGWIDLEDQGAPVDQEQLVRRLEFKIPTAGVPDRSKIYLAVRVKDKVGLWSELKVSDQILIDQTPPTKPEVGCALYTRSQEEILGISCESFDPESGITHYRMGLVTAVGGEWLVTKLGAMNEFDGNLTHLQLTEAGVYQIAIQTLNATGDWSEIGYSEPITVDSIEPELVFVKYNETIVINEPPLNVEYILNEDAKVKFTIIGKDGKSYEEEVSGVKGINQYVFNKTDKQIYFVSAIPTDLAGNPGVATEKTNQTIRVNAPPEIVLEGINATPGQPLRLKATVTDPDGEPGDIFTYEWLPGDGGAVLSGVEPEYRYTVLGEYELTLTVTDKDGGKTSKFTPITIGNTTGGTLYMDEVWSRIHRIYEDVTVPAGINLTIKPGTQVIVDGTPGEGYFHGLIIKGDLIIEGSGVTFNSSQNGKGAWKGIRVEGRTNIDGVEILKAAWGLTVVNNATVTVTNSNFHDNQVGIHIYRANPVIQGTVFRNNDWYGIKEDGECSPLVTHCMFTENEVDYYHDKLTAVTMEELNGIGENEGNSN